MLTLLDDTELRESTAAEGMARAKSLLRWDEERSRLLSAIECALGGKVRTAAQPVAIPAHD
jgi:hypothetical protein